MTTLESRTLDNGLVVICESIPGVRSLGLCWLIPGGHGHDEPEMDGRATVTSELLQRGAGDLDSRAQADAFDFLGAARGVEPGVRFMRVTGAMLGERFGDALPLYRDTVLAPRFDEASLGPAAELALQDLESLADDPHRRAALAARARHHRPPFDRSGMGTPEGIRALTRDAIADRWHAHARPKGSILALAGDLDPSAAIARVEDALGAWRGAAPELETGGEAPRGYAHEPDDGAQVQVIVVHDAPPERDDDAPLERVVVGVLSGGMSARLFTEVREKRGLCYAVQAGYRAERDHGSVTAYVGTTPERAQESLDVLIAELERIHETGVEPEEFERTRARIKAGLVFSGESTGARAGALAADQYKLGRPRTLEEIAGVYERLTLDEVNAYLQRRSLGRMTIQTLGPAALTAPG